MPIILKTREEIKIMREAGRIAALALAAMRDAVRPGITTAELDRIAAEVLARHDAGAAFLGYPPGSTHPFPATITASINEELVHGIPGERVLQEGDIISLDIGAVHKGFVGDVAITVAVGQISPEAHRLMEVTEQALYEGVRASQAGKRTGDVSHTIQSYVESHGMSVVREYTGHGVGRKMHEDPQIPNWGRPGRGPLLKYGMTYALEPMVMLGNPATQVLDDHWTVVTQDGKLCAHFEHTVAITENGPDILTKID
jgi:methionyl aminopeptidase